MRAGNYKTRAPRASLARRLPRVATGGALAFPGTEQERPGSVAEAYSLGAMVKIMGPPLAPRRIVTL